jgi:hypothetical protein
MRYPLAFPNLAAWPVLVSLLLSCGGTKLPPGQARSTGSSERDTASDESSAEQPSIPECTNGSCFVCGAGICLPGFFCDESSAQPSCQWLAKCGPTNSCSCLREAFGGKCACAERHHGVFLKCDT